MPPASAAVLPSSELTASTRCVVIAIVLCEAVLDRRPSWRAELSRLDD